MPPNSRICPKMTTVKNNTEEIAFLLTQVVELQSQLENCHAAIMAMSDTDLQKVYAQETIPLTTDYELLTGLLEEALENHFKWEKENNEPINLAFRRTHKQLAKK